jgi:hypothetical protein
VTVLIYTPSSNIYFNLIYFYVKDTERVEYILIFICRNARFLLESSRTLRFQTFPSFAALFFLLRRPAAINGVGDAVLGGGLLLRRGCPLRSRGPPRRPLRHRRRHRGEAGPSHILRHLMGRRPLGHLHRRHHHVQVSLPLPPSPSKNARSFLPCSCPNP